MTEPAAPRQGGCSALLSEEDLQRITGHKRKGDQLQWLVRHRWVHHLNRLGQPVVGRWYADRKLAGLNPGDQDADGGIDLSKVR